MLRDYSEEPVIVRKGFVIFFLLFNAIAWIFMTPIMIDSILNNLTVTHSQNFIIWAAYYVTVAGSSIVGPFLSERTGRITFLCLWTILGVVTSLLPALFNCSTLTCVLVVSVLLGISTGVGMPSCLAYFADCTFVENRGRIGGIILLVTNLSAPLLAVPLMMFSLTVNSIIFAVWRGFGLIIFLLKPEEKNISKLKKDVSFASVLYDKSFILYFVAWLMFCFVDRFEQPILKNLFGDFYYLMMGPIIGSISALIGGILCDWVGRKRVVLYGFATLGIAYAIISIAPEPIVSWYLYITIGSMSTGILWVTFILILWGDLSQSGTREKYYVIGEIPYFLTGVIRVISAPYVTMIPVISAFSLASFFLFLAVLPLLYAPETLPERKIKLRQLKTYAEKARKIKEKYGIDKAAEN